MDDIGSDDRDTLTQCERVLGYTFRDRELLQRCLTHASISRTRLDSNERLEFLGDAILGAAVCELLYKRYPEEAEGGLTRIKSFLVSRATCARISREMGLHDFLLLGKGVTASHEVPSSIRAAVFESLVAGIYLDGGHEVAFEFVQRIIEPEIERGSITGQSTNYKSMLQHQCQKVTGTPPVYQILDEKGPDHLKCFQICANLGAKRYSPAWGASKKEAEQRAAENAWFEMLGQLAPHTEEN